MTRVLTAFAVAASLLATPVVAQAQSETVGTTTATVVRADSAFGAVVAQEHNRLANTPKFRSLLGFAGTDLGAAGGVTADVANGFQVAGVVRFQRAGVTVATDQSFVYTFVPLAGRFTRYPGASAAVMHVHFPGVPALSYTRLLVRYGNNGAMIEEYAYRKDGRVTKMTAKFGDCLVRSAFPLLQKRTPQAYNSLYGTFANSARDPVLRTLRQLYDPRVAPVGQRTMFLYTSLLAVSNFEEEWAAGYIDGSIDQAFKPERGDSAIVTQIKAFAKDILKNLLQQVGKALWSVIAGWLGI